MLYFPQKFQLFSNESLKDDKGFDVLENGEVKIVKVPKKVVSGWLTKRKQVNFNKDTNRYESSFYHNIRLNPSEITEKEINPGDAIQLLDTDRQWKIESIFVEYFPTQENTIWYIRLPVYVQV